MLSEYRNSFSLGQKVLDSSVVLLSWMLAYLFRFHLLEGGQTGLQLEFLKVGLLLILISLYSLYRQNLYESLRFTSRHKEVLSIIKGNTVSGVSLIILLYFFSEDRVSRLTILIYFFLSTFLLIVVRMSIRNLLRSFRKKGRNLRHILLVGNSSLIINYISIVRNYKDSGIRFLGWIDSDGLAEKENIKPIHCSYEKYRENTTPDSITIAYSGESNNKAQKFIMSHYNDVIPIQILPDLSYSMIGHQIEDFGGLPLLSVNKPSFNPLESTAKRLIDLVGALFGTLMISPLLLTIAAGVKLSSRGPIFFGQQRVGLDGEEFTMWKFRSMKMATRNALNEEWSNKNNPRKTRLGQFIRRTSLDELPQLFNVLIGQMSLVGPRPEQPFFVDQFRYEIPGYMLKHKMKPGMTGWAQVNGWRGDTDLNKRIECDIYYIKHWSLWLDFKVLFLTIFKGFINKNAY